MRQRLGRLPALRSAVVVLLFVSAVLAAAPAALAQDPAPAATVGVDSGGGGAPAPAPDPAPDAGGGTDSGGSSSGSGGGGGSSAPPPSAPEPEAEPSGDATPAETQEQKDKRKQKNDPAPAQTAETATEPAAATDRETDGPFAGGAVEESTGESTGAVTETGGDAQLVEDELATPTTASQPVAFSPPQEPATGSSGASPALIGLFALSILLLGAAAIPPSRIREGSVGTLLTTRRLEIGLVGAAVLTIAALGLLVTVVAD